ncbi:alpha/beta fold hydrolase [Sphingomonas sp. MMS24-JH45]
MLHALGASGGAWAEVSARLADKYHCVAPDLPGFGEEPAARRRHRDARLAHRQDRAAVARRLSAGRAQHGGQVRDVARSAGGGQGLAGLAGVVLLAGSPPTPDGRGP